MNHNFFVDDGRAANRAFWAQWFAAFPDTQVSLDDVVVEHWDQLDTQQFMAQLTRS